MTLEIHEVASGLNPKWVGKVCGPGARWRPGRSIEEVIGTLFRRYAYKFYDNAAGYEIKIVSLAGYSETFDAMGRVIERGNCKTHLQIAPKEKI